MLDLECPYCTGSLFIDDGAIEVVCSNCDARWSNSGNVVQEGKHADLIDRDGDIWKWWADHPDGPGYFCHDVSSEEFERLFPEMVPASRQLVEQVHGPIRVDSD